MYTESSKATSDNCDAEMSKCSGDNGEEPGSQPLTAVTNVKTVGTGQEENGKKRGFLSRRYFVRDGLGSKENKRNRVKKRLFRFLKFPGIHFI